MKSSENGNIAVILLVILVIAGAIGSAIFFIMPKTDTPAQQIQQDSLSIGQSRPTGDINDDGSVTVVDVQLVRGQIGCTSESECWNTVVGKTLSGDNPIYASDLDLDGDSAITDADADIVNQNVGQ
jgi:hypothetical protein